MVDIFNGCILGLFDSTVPLRQVVNRNIDEVKLWFSSQIGNSINDREDTYRRWRVTRSDDDRENYRRNRSTQLIRTT